VSFIWRLFRAVLLCMVCLCNWADDPGHHQVLILHSYHQNYSWTANIHAAMMQTLLASDAGVDIRTEYLDWKRFPTQDMLARYRETILAKYRNVRFDVVLTSDNAALEFAVQHRDTLFPAAPIVFCGVNGWRPDLYGKQGNVTGIAEQVEAAGTLSLALKAHPGTKRVLVVCDLTETGQEIRMDVDHSLAPLGQLPEIIYIGKENTQDLLLRLAKEPSRTLTLLALFGNDASGRFLDLWELPEILSGSGVQAPSDGLRCCAHREAKD
jgi:two-component system, cell cycle sensor histidine kinase and response regulator CckA